VWLKKTKRVSHWKSIPLQGVAAFSSYMVLQGVAGCCRILHGVTWCCRVSQGLTLFTECYKVLQGDVGCYRVLQGVTGCFRLFKGVVGRFRRDRPNHQNQRFLDICAGASLKLLCVLLCLVWPNIGEIAVPVSFLTSNDLGWLDSAPCTSPPIPVPSSSSSNGTTTTPLTTRGLCPGDSVI